MDPYEVLGIDTSASEEEIKNKYINLLAEYTKIKMILHQLRFKFLIQLTINLLMDVYIKKLEV